MCLFCLTLHRNRNKFADEQPKWSDECKNRIAEVTAIAIAKAQHTLRLLNNVQHIKTAFKTLQYNSERAYNLLGSFLSSEHRASMDFFSLLARCGFTKPVLALLLMEPTT